MKKVVVLPTLLDPDSVAFEGIRLIVLGRDRLSNQWRDFTGDLTSDVLPYLERCVWAYQMQILCDEAARRFGPLVADSVKDNLSKYFGTVPGSVSGKELLEAVAEGRAA